MKLFLYNEIDQEVKLVSRNGCLKTLKNKTASNYIGSGFVKFPVTWERLELSTH